MSEQNAERPWLAWSDGRYPEDTIGDVIAAYADGTIVLDDSLTIWNPLRALAFVAAGGVLQGAAKPEKAPVAEKKRVRVQRLVRSPLRRADDDAWNFVRRMKEEWTYEDWEDFYEGIKGAMEKIAERHRAPNHD